MTIKRDDLDKRKVNFSDVSSGRRLPPVHPGEILRDELLTPMAISVYALSNAIKVPRSGSTTSCSGAAPSRRTPPYVSGGTSVCRRSSGSICRPGMISTWLSAPCGDGSSKRSHRTQHDVRAAIPMKTNQLRTRVGRSCPTSLGRRRLHVLRPVSTYSAARAH